MTNSRSILSPAPLARPLLLQSDLRHCGNTLRSLGRHLGRITHGRQESQRQIRGPGTDGTTLREIVHISIGGPSVRVSSPTNSASTRSPSALHRSPSAPAAAPSPQAPQLHSPSAGHPPSSFPPARWSSAIPPPSKSLPCPISPSASSFPISQSTNSPSIASPIRPTTSSPATSSAPPRSTPPPTFFSWDFLKGVDVSADDKAASIVTFGDSITDGAHSTRDANARWPDVLARRLQADKKTANLGVLNEGIGGNRVLHDTTGPSALARFDRDVLAQAGVKYLIIMESINDIGHATDPAKPYDVVTAEDLIVGLSQLAIRAHTHGIKVYGATLTPFVGAKYQSPAGEEMRQAVNKWIRTTNQLDGVIDFDKVTTDPTHPGMFLVLDDSGDHLHPGDDGYKAMGESIDLKLFTK